MMRNAYSYDREEASYESGISFSEPSRAVQSQRDQADINVIVRRFGVTGVASQSLKIPLKDQFLEVGSYHEAMNLLRETKDAFLKVPAAIRSRFSNDPSKFVDFCSDPANIQELRELGLAVNEENSDGSRKSRPAGDSPVKSSRKAAQGAGGDGEPAPVSSGVAGVASPEA